MIVFIARRIGSMVLILLFLTAAVFLLQRVSKVDPVRAAVGQNASKQVVEAERERLGYDEPIFSQYLSYVGDAATGNLQTSLRTKQPVASDIENYLPASLELVLAALVFAVPMALFFGISGAARWRGTGPLRLLGLVLAAAPPFVLGILAIVFFYKKLGWLPASGRTELLHPPEVTWDAIQHLLLPAFTLALLPAVAVGRVLRGGIITNLRADHVRVARAKGLTEWQVLRRHTLRNAAGPALAMAGIMLGVMFASLTVVEVVFSWPGLGSYIAASLPGSDFPAIAGVTLLLGTVYVVVNTTVDILQAAADPRIRQ